MRVVWVSLKHCVYSEPEEVCKHMWEKGHMETLRGQERGLDSQAT